MRDTACPCLSREQVIGDLPVDGMVAAGIDVLGEHTATAHADFAPQLVLTSTTVSVPEEDPEGHSPLSGILSADVLSVRRARVRNEAKYGIRKAQP
jgi:hypothetical protein